jgi:phosphoserine phosphatase RsbU/P
LNPVLQAIARAALDATGAEASWVLGLIGDHLEAMGAAGPQAGELLGVVVPVGAGTVGYVVSSGQPMAIAPRGADPRLSEGLGARLGRMPASLLCVPCHHEDAIVGALELVDKAGGAPFSIDDVELVTLLGGIAGAALSLAGAEVPARPPAELASELVELSSSDPAAYARLSVVLEALLARG